MCDARTETERLLAEQRDRALSDRDRAEAHLRAARGRIRELEAAISEAMRDLTDGRPKLVSDPDVVAAWNILWSVCGEEEL